jgi:hypothetical protein
VRVAERAAAVGRDRFESPTVHFLFPFSFSVFPTPCPTVPLNPRPGAAGLQSLRDGHSLVAASMDGALLRWDLRQSLRPVLRCGGHVNSHSIV